ncbi:hypothetical protein AB7X03_10855 [Providencia rettgeri]
MSVIKNFDDWYEKLSWEDKNKILGYIIKVKCKIDGCEGFYAGPHGALQEGLFVAPSGSSVQKKCPVCGK